MVLSFKRAKALMTQVKEHGATDSAIESFTTRTYMIRFANNEVTVSKRFEEESVRLYVAIGPQRAVTGTTDVTASGLKLLVNDALRLVKNTPPSDMYAPLPAGPFSYDPRLLDQRIKGVGRERLVDMVEAAVNNALSAGANRVAGSLVFAKTHRSLLTTGGVEAESHKDTIELSVRAFLDGESSGQFALGSGDLNELNPELVGWEAGEIAKTAKDPREISEGSYDTVIGPMTSANLLEEVGSMASAFYVDLGMSFLAGLLGKEVTSKALTLVDDPTVPRTFGAEAFDEEGLPTKRTVLIEGEVLKSYLHNSATARKFNTSSTANAGIIVPHPHNLIVEGGTSTVNKLLTKLDRGILITNDWYLRYQDISKGDFSTITRDGLFLIRNGTIEHAVKGLRLSDNFLRLLKNIEEVSMEKYPIRWWEVEVPVRAPYLLLRDVRFTRPTS
ncbi:MAG: TldD/PmbA family protein [Thaumarchaeota archaeon]|nr:TldD/PmbA family protein [Candidatus Calditenuaceae archaeon]MDW8186541.1 TldD/PmbA family protein [Nitrososphaerota archaeon]